jgi:iron complex transport system permease protein
MLLAGLPLCVGLLLLALLASVAVGAADVDARSVWRALFAFSPGSTDQLIIRTLRVPRAATAALVGAALGVAGSLMQGLTRNPLADPGILGIETGAALGVVTAVFFFHITSLTLYALFAFGGAVLTAGAVFALGSLGRGGPNPLRITIAGAALTALLSSWTTGILLLNQRTLEEVRFWLAGSVAGRDLTLLGQAAPYLLAGLVLALALGRQVTILALGDDLARGVGQRTARVKLLATLATILLAGSAVAVAGPIGFVGLIIPHVVRLLVGADYRWIVPYAALAGALFLVIADIAARLILRPLELPLGVVTALTGGPFFVALVRWRVKR